MLIISRASKWEVRKIAIYTCLSIHFASCINMYLLVSMHGCVFVNSLPKDVVWLVTSLANHYFICGDACGFCYHQPFSTAMFFSLFIHTCITKWEDTVPHGCVLVAYVGTWLGLAIQCIYYFLSLFLGYFFQFLFAESLPVCLWILLYTHLKVFVSQERWLQVSFICCLCCTSDCADK